MTPGAGWPRRVAPLRVEVPCSGRVHTVLWRRGALVLADHDPVADAVLVALGGEPPACLEVQRSWRLGYVEEEPPVVSAGLVRSLSSLAAWMSGSGSRPVVLPEPLRRLREASLLHTWGRGLRDPGAGRTAQQRFLERAVARRVSDLAVVQMRTACGARAGDDVHVDIGRDAEEPSAEGRADATSGRLRITVPVGWLTAVWVRGLETWRSGLVLAATRSGAGGWSLLTARWSPDGAGGWELGVAWEERPS